MLLCLFLAALFVYVSPAPSSGAAPSAVVSETEYSFGECWQGDMVAHTFKVKNAGDQELRIEGQKFTGLHTSARFKRSVPPGQEMDVTISVDSTKFAGDVDTGLILQTNDPAQPRIEFHLQGHIRTILTFQPLRALFFSSYKGESPEKSIAIVNNYEKPLQIKRIESKSDRFSFSLETIKEGREYRFSAKVNPKAYSGRTREEVTFFTDSVKLPQFTVGVNILVKDDVYAFPEDIDFGTVSIDQMRNNPKQLDLLKQTVLVKRREGKGKDFQIKLEHNIPFISIKKDPESGSETYRLDVSPIPEKMTRGKINSSIRVITNDKEVPEIKIPVVGEIR